MPSTRAILFVFALIAAATATGGCGKNSGNRDASKASGTEIFSKKAQNPQLPDLLSGKDKKPEKAQKIVPPLPDLKDRTTWDACFVAGKKVGYNKTHVSHVRQNGQEVAVIESLTSLSIQRFGRTTEMQIRLINSQTAGGRLIDFESRVTAGSDPLLTRGRVEDGKLTIDIFSEGKKQIVSIPWSDDFAGPFGVEQMLLGNPMRPGERREIRTLIPIVNQVAATNLFARGYEPVELLSGTHRLLRIDTKAVLPDGQEMVGSIWTNRKGDTLKTYSKAAHQELIRTTKSDAMDESDLGEIDFGIDLKIPVGRPLTADEIARRARYRIHIEGEDAAAVLVESASQQVRPLGPETAEVTVYALRPGGKNANPHPPNDQPDVDDIEPNNLVQSDNAKIVDMAEEAAGELADPWQTAVALEKYVKEHITKKDFSTAFASAAEVAETRQGDCTEHAVLLAALARARGIPARGVMGLVYLPDDQAFFYHMWTEVFIRDRWIPLDATMGKGGTGAARIELARSNLKGASAFSSFLPIARVMGRMTVELIDDIDADKGKDAK